MWSSLKCPGIAKESDNWLKAFFHESENKLIQNHRVVLFVFISLLAFIPNNLYQLLSFLPETISRCDYSFLICAGSCCNSSVV